MVPALVTAGDVPAPKPELCAPGDLFTDVPVEALVAEGELWVRGAGGTLASIELGGADRIRYHLPQEPVLDLLRGSDDTLWALTFAEGPQDMRVWLRTESGWSPVWQMGAPSESMALVELGGRPAVLTAKRLFTTHGGLRSRALEPALPDVTQYQVAADRGGVWVSARGVGWLYRVDASTGSTLRVQAVGDGPCEGLLDPRCDVITDLDRDPLRAGCAVLTTRGRVVRACDDGEVSVVGGVGRAVRADWIDKIEALAMLFPDASPSRARLLALAKADNPSKLVSAVASNLPALESDAIVALSPTDSGFVALGEQGLYRVHGDDGHAVPVGSGRRVCGLAISDTPHAVVVNHDNPLPLLVSKSAPPVSPPSRTLPPAPCGDTVVFYADGERTGADGVSVVLRCEQGLVSMVERAQPRDRTFVVPQISWRALWRDLERAEWRTWEGCTPTEGATGLGARVMISTPDHTLSVDCPASELSTRQRAVLERLHAITTRLRGNTSI